MQHITVSGAVGLLSLLWGVHALYPLNGLAQTPQMGWDNWNAFGCDVSEELLLNTAQSIVAYGLRDAGYQYILLDDCWSAGRSSNGSLQANTTKFPNGMAYIADQLHGMGLKFGMYSDAGRKLLLESIGRRIDPVSPRNIHLCTLRWVSGL